jgi:hypothetical protein
MHPESRSSRVAAKSSMMVYRFVFCFAFLVPKSNSQSWSCSFNSLNLNSPDPTIPQPLVLIVQSAMDDDLSPIHLAPPSCEPASCQGNLFCIPLARLLELFKPEPEWVLFVDEVVPTNQSPGVLMELSCTGVTQVSWGGSSFSEQHQSEDLLFTSNIDGRGDRYQSMHAPS